MDCAHRGSCHIWFAIQANKSASLQSAFVAHRLFAGLLGLKRPR